MRQPDAKNPFNQKAVVGYERLLTKLPPASCTIYGAGLDYQSAFERRLAARTQCAIHTFDCTLTDPVRLERFLRHQQKSLRAEQVRWDNLHRSSKLRAGRHNLAYHPWCLGDLSTDEQQSSNDTATNADRKKAYDAGAVDTANTFTLDTVMTNLGHKSDEEDTGGGVNLLKLDIEGYEWQLFGMLLDESITDPATLPMQISFELHTEAGGENTFPLTLSLHALFARLWKLGYRVVFKEVNGGDTACAEFVVYRFFSDA
jgi:hypothetical protein